jgi:hypothetical protein
LGRGARHVDEQHCVTSARTALPSSTSSFTFLLQDARTQKRVLGVLGAVRQDGAVHLVEEGGMMALALLQAHVQLPGAADDELADGLLKVGGR